MIMKKKTGVKDTLKNVFKSTSSILLDKCNKAIVNEIAKDHHAEAKEIIQLASEELRQEFLKYHEEDKGNICCLVLDKAKRDLINEGKLTEKPEDAFGKPFML
jgi:hypothetical protein